MSDSPETAPKPRRPRKTKAEREAARAARLQAEEIARNKPIDPKIWMLVGVLVLFVAFWTWADPVTFAEAGQPSSQSILQLVPLILIRAFGKTPSVILLTIIGIIPLLSGLIGWLRQRFGPGKTEGQ